MFSTGPPEFFTVRPSARLHFTIACNGPEVVEYSFVGACRTVVWPTPTGKSHSLTSVLARALLHSQIHRLPIFSFHGRVFRWRHHFLSDTKFFQEHVSNPMSDTFASTICNFFGFHSCFCLLALRVITLHVVIPHLFVAAATACADGCVRLRTLRRFVADRCANTHCKRRRHF